VRDGRGEARAKLLVGSQLTGSAEVEQRLPPPVDVVGDEQRLVTARAFEELVRNAPAFGDPVQPFASTTAGGDHPVLCVEHEQHLAALLDEHPGSLGVEPQGLDILAVLFAVPREEPPHDWLRVWRRS
jgi:hypothetical protein